MQLLHINRFLITIRMIIVEEQAQKLKLPFGLLKGMNTSLQVKDSQTFQTSFRQKLSELNLGIVDAFFLYAAKKHERACRVKFSLFRLCSFLVALANVSVGHDDIVLIKIIAWI